jgi:hypothetical protein
MLRADSPAAARRIGRVLLESELTAPAEQGGGLVVIETVYDGEDLAEVGTPLRLLRPTAVRLALIG